MKLVHSLFVLLSLSCASSAQISSLKAVMFNATNGKVVADAALSFTNSVGFEGGASGTIAATTRTNLGLGASWLTNTTREAFQNDMFTTNKWIVTGGPSIYSIVASWSSGTWDFRMPLNVTDPVGADMPSYKAMTRTNLGLGATWLTNTSETLFRAAIGLGSTNTASFAGINIGQSTITYGGASPDAFRVKLLSSDVLIVASDAASFNVPVSSSRFTVGIGSDSVSINHTGILFGGVASATTRTNLGLGAAWITNSTAPLTWASVPVSPTNSGTAGQIAYTNNYLYIAISNNTWRRVQLGTW